MRIFGRRLTSIAIPGGTDEVVIGFPLPAGGVLNNVHMEWHIIGPEDVVLNHAGMYGIGGYVVPVVDPDAALSYDTIWDNLIPKDTAQAAGALDLDTAAADATPEFEPGEPRWSGIFDLTSLAPKEIFRRRKLLSIASAQFGHQVIVSASDTWVPTDYFNTKVGQKVRVKSPSMVLFGFSSPTLDAVSTSQKTAPTENEWTLLQYVEVAMEQMFFQLIGLVEAGAETPYVESAAFIARLLEDVIFEETAAFIDTMQWQVYCKATFDISVPGTISQATLSSEGV